MLKNLAVSGVAVAAVVLGAPAATADAPSYDCRLLAVEQDDVTGANYQGVLAGVIAHADASPVSIKCRLKINGTTVAETPVGSGTAVAATHQDVSFAVADTDVLQVCADYTSSHGSGTTCVTLGAIQIPPQIVYDVVDELIVQIYEPWMDAIPCSVLKSLAGDYGGLVYVNTQGDVYLNGEPQYDCPPYDIVWD